MYKHDADVKPFEKKIWLSSPTMHGDELKYMQEAYETIGSYDSVINCVGLLNQFAESNHAQAVLINSYLPHFLASITDGTELQALGEAFSMENINLAELERRTGITRLYL